MKVLKAMGLMVLMTVLFSRTSMAQASPNVIQKNRPAGDTTKRRKPVQLPGPSKKKNAIDTVYKVPEDKLKQPAPDTMLKHIPK